MTIKADTGRNRSRDGIALVVVLGLLAMMTLLATAFVYFMRTENTIANYYRMDISSRHVLNVALARALMDVSDELNTNVYPNWDGNYNTKPSQAVYDAQNRDCREEFVSAMMSAISNIPGGAFVPLGVHEQALPNILYTTNANLIGNNCMVINLTKNNGGWVSAIQGNYVTVTNKRGLVKWTKNDRFAAVPLPKWDLVDVDQMTSKSATSGKQVQYAYMVFNCSGLLDANYVGSSGTVRQLGLSPAEIQLNGLTNEFPNQLAVDDFFAARDSFNAKYENIPELFEMNYGFDHWPQNFTVYSRFPRGGFTPSAPVMLGGNLSYLQTLETPFKTSLITSDTNRFTASNSKWVYDSLLDYVDSDSIPTNLMGPSMELCPMINEIGITNVILFKTDGTFSHIIMPRLEVIYPYLTPPKVNTYSLEVDLEFIAMPSTDARFLPSPKTFSIVKTIPALNVNTKYYTINLFPPPIVVGGVYTNLPATKTNLQMIVRVNRAQIYDSPAGGTHRLVDAVPFPANAMGSAVIFFLPSFEPALLVPPNAVAAAVTYSDMAGAECVDPRFNWRRLVGAKDYYWKQYRPITSTFPDITQSSIGSANHCATSYWSSSLCSDPFAAMHVSNQPLKSIAELGYLPVGKWDTVRLVGGIAGGTNFAPDRIFNLFSLTTNGMDRGMVNPNTYNTDVLTAMFCDMPMDQFPLQGNPPRLSASQAYSLATNWANSVVQKPIANYSDLMEHIGNVMELFPFSNHVFSADNHSPPFRNESLIRNTIGLFNARQNYFYILIVASETTKGMSVVSSKGSGLNQTIFTLNTRSALVEVWRDPYKDTSGKNPLIIRSYKLLDD